MQKPTHCLFLSHWLVHKPCSMFSKTVYFDITMSRTSLQIVYFKTLNGAQTLYFLFGKSPTVVFVLHVDVGPRSQQASTAGQANCTSAVVWAASTVSSSFIPFSPSILDDLTIGMVCPYNSLSPSIARRDVTDVTSVFIRVSRCPCKFPTRRFSCDFRYVCFLSPSPIIENGEFYYNLIMNN